MIESLPGFTNFRPVGSAALQAGTRLEVYRAETPDRISDEDLRSVSERIDAVIDLRTDAERARIPHPLADASGYRPRSLIDPDVEMGPRETAPELLDIYKDWAARHSRTMLAIFTELAGLPRGRVLICCAAGKDRTGVVSALVARLRGGDVATIAADYAMTAERMAGRFAAELAAAPDPLRIRPMQRSDPETVEAFIAHIEQTNGSVARYLAWLGLRDELIAALRAEADHTTEASGT